MHALVADVGVTSVLQSSQFDLEEDYTAYRRSRNVDWEDEAPVGWFPYDNGNGDVTDLPAREITRSNRAFSAVQAKKSDGVVSVVFMSGH